MVSLVNAILINETDNVATAIANLSEGGRGRYWAHGQIVEVEIAEQIPQYHKFAICPIRRAELVRKYGEVIGQAVKDICKGAHVHVHNIVSPGRLEK